MAKRQTFYTRADLFEAEISPRAKLVLAYLSRVSNKLGQSYPAVATVAEKCGCCPNSARKALKELEAAGFIRISLNTLPTRRGGRRCTSNTYTLLFLPSKDEGAPLQPVQGGTARDAGPRYDREITMDVPKGHSPSVEATDPDPDPDQGETSLKTILFRLQLDLFEDRPFAKAVRHALRRMYHSDSIRVKGERIPRETVREALSLLTIDHIDFVERQLREATSQVVCGEAYLMSCLYNAPLDCLAKSRCG